MLEVCRSFAAARLSRARWLRQSAVVVLALVGTVASRAVWAQQGAVPNHSRSAAPPARHFAKILVAGRLEHSQGRDRSRGPYLLRKRDGSVRCYVVPSRGVHLDSLVGTKVGIRGFGTVLADDTNLIVHAQTVRPIEAAPGDVQTQRVTPRSVPPQVAQSEGLAAGAGSRRGPPQRVGPATARSPRYSDVAVRPAQANLAEQPDAAIGSAEPIIADPVPEDVSDGVSEPFGIPVEVAASPPCDGACSGMPGQPCPRCGVCGLPGSFWIRGEYLHWWTDGMAVPPLVTGSPAGTSVDNAGVLGVDGTQILFGGNDILDGSRSGGRLRFGTWLDGRRRFGVEGEYFELEQESLDFIASSNAAGNPILARPFFNINPRDSITGNPDPPAREDSELVSFPGILAGAVSVAASTELRSGRVRALWNVCCMQDPCGGPCSLGHSSRLDFLAGYRVLKLEEMLIIREDLTSLESSNRGSFDIFDRFDTSNEFHGVELGFLWQHTRGRWFLETLGVLGLGNNHQVVVIDGQTITSPLVGPQTTATGGLLAQRSNIGLHSRDDFAVAPELGVTVGYRLTRRLSATLGYTFLYLSRAVRPGDQIDLDVNPDFLPPEQVPFTGPLRPALTMNDTDFWAQGWSAGLDYRW